MNKITIFVIVVIVTILLNQISVLSHRNLKNKKSENGRGKKKRSAWLPPEDALMYFSPESDADFKARHPVGYIFLVLLLFVAIVLPAIVYCVCMSAFSVELNNLASFILGMVGSFAIGVGLANFVAIIIKQYMGHLVSVISFALGILMIAVSIIMI